MVDTHNSSAIKLPQTDAVVRRLMAAGDKHAASALHWLDSKQLHRTLRRRATWCVVVSWLMVTAAMAIGAFVSWNFSRHADGFFFEDVPMISVVMPPTLIALAGLSLFGGLIALASQHFPGLASTHQAIDWSQTGDAVSRLLDAGCTYPEAFRAAAEVASTPDNRNWLKQAAAMVEQGASAVNESVVSTGDTAIVELLIQSDESDPAYSWRMVAEHFIEIARSRLALLLSAAPILSTLLAGLIVWLSISATLGAMWRYAVHSIGGLS